LIGVRSNAAFDQTGVVELNELASQWQELRPKLDATERELTARAAALKQLRDARPSVASFRDKSISSDLRAAIDPFLQRLDAASDNTELAELKKLVSEFEELRSRLADADRLLEAVTPQTSFSSTDLQTISFCCSTRPERRPPSLRIWRAD
jgi:DNA repair exonuclease SbcCD ATPase subunit